MKKQKGQAIVEFALVLPLFMLLLFGLLTAGFLFADYMTLSNVARSSAREAALGVDRDTIKNNYKSNTHLLSNMYTWSGDGDSFKFDDGELPNSVKVTVKTTLNTNFPGVGVVKSMTDFPPNTYEINYTMHDETIDTTNSGNS